MKKLITLLLVLTGCVMTANATSLTVYFAVPASTVNNGSYNVVFKVFTDNWFEHGMTKTSKTYFGKYIYSYTYDEGYSGVHDIQFIIRNGETQTEYNWPIKNTWTVLGDFNGKMYEWNTGFRNYNYDKTVTIHCKKDGDWIPTKCHNYFNDGSSDVPETDWPGKATTQSTLNGDWYDYTITGRPCTAMIFHNNNGSQTQSIPVGDATEYWVVNGVSSTTALSEVPASYNYTRSITDGKFGTICLPYNATVTGATVYEISSKIMDGETFKGVNLTEVTGNTIVAGRAYIFKGTSSTLTATLSGNAYSGSTASGTGLVGNLATDAIELNGTGSAAYVLSNNKICRVVSGGVGDYVAVNQYRAYIDPSALPSGARSAKFLDCDDETTGIEAVNVNTESANVSREYFNLSGQRVANPSKGLYIVNGKKVIIK